MPQSEYGRSDFSKYDSMTTEELENILRHDTDEYEDETDIEKLMYVAEVIRVRKGPDPSRKTPEEAFEIFKTHYMPTDSEIEDFVEYSDTETEQKKNSTKVIPMPRWMRRLVSAAAVIAVIIAGSMTASALGYNIWAVFVQWTEETFHFSGTQNQVSTPPAKDNQDEYESLQDALDRYKITLPLAPKWIPEGYELTEIRVSESPIQVVFGAMYRNGDNALKIQIKQFIDSDPEQIEQSGILIEKYESVGTIYYIFKDNNQLRAAWSVDSFECYISGELSIDAMRQIIDSIKE